MLLLGLGLVGATRRSQAQQSTQEVVVTGTRTPEQSQRATVKADVVTRAEAERRNATNVAEALATQPGVSVNPGAYGYLGTVSPIQMQGFDLGRVLILEDGEPVIGDVGGAIDLSRIPIADVERIEIVSGPTSALYGSSAIGGVVNIISAPPHDEGASARGRAEYGTRRRVVSEASAAYRAPSAWAALDLSHTRQDGVALLPGLPDLQIPESARSLVGLRVGTQLSRKIDVQLRARWLHQRFDGLQSDDVPGLGRYETDLPQTSDRFAVHFLETLRFGRGSSLRFSLVRQWVNDSTKREPRNSPLADEHHSTQALASFESTATLADGPRTWVLGARFEAQRQSQELHQTERVNDTLLTTTTPEVVPQNLSNAAAYAQLSWKLGRYLTALPGARAEYHGRYGSVLAPRLALALRPHDGFTVRAAVGRGFRTPSAEELGFNFDHSVYGYRVIGNPRLTPERSWGFNADLAWAPLEALSLRGGAFLNLVTDQIDIDLAGGNRSGSVVSYTYVNYQQVRTAGASFGATVLASERVQLDATYDYLSTRDLTSHQPISGRPAHTLTASARFDLPWHLQLYSRAHFVSSAFVDTKTNSPGYETVDVRAARSLGSAVSAYLGVSNAFDVHQDPGRVGDLRPPTGRTLYAGVRGNWPEEAP